MWAVDPVDGTSNYVYGSPLWGVSIALIQDNEITVGCVFLPDLSEMYSAENWGGAFCNGHRLKPVPPGPILPTELMSYNDTLLRKHPGHVWPGKMRCSGAFVIDAMWVAQQRFRGLIGIRGKLYDVAASVLINREVEADVSYVDGSRFEVAELMAGITIPMPYSFLPKGAGPLMKTLQG
jgi:myo-inositol-1(or 4)-monophosphatase